MTYDPDIHHRRSIRLKGYDYAGAGWYFVTLCVWQRECLFGEVVDGGMRLNAVGGLVESLLHEMKQRFPSVVVDSSVIMPNHIHLIVPFVGAGLGPPDELETSDNPGQIAIPKGAASRAPTLGDVICAFKSISAIRINKLRNNPGGPVWQRNYYERVIRDDHELTAIRDYIAINPLQWEADSNNPNNL